MASQRCPKCKSKRVRLGYRPTSIFLKLIFRYHLLCDDCNWEFTGFGIPGTVAKKTRKRKANNINPVDDFERDEDLGLINEILSSKKKDNDSETDFSISSNTFSEQKIEPPQISLIEKKTNLENINHESNKSPDSGLKKQRVKKKIKVKYY